MHFDPVPRVDAGGEVQLVHRPVAMFGTARSPRLDVFSCAAAA